MTTTMGKVYGANLLSAIEKSGIDQQTICFDLRIDPALMSKVVKGKLDPPRDWFSERVASHPALCLSFDVLKEWEAIARMIVLLGVYGGLRREEMVDLQLDNVKLADGVIKVVDGKGRKNRDVGMMPILVEQVEAYIAKHRGKFGPGAFLLDAQGVALDNRTLNRRLKRLADKAGIDITPHGLRVTMATWLEDSGMPITYTQSLLGHSSLETTRHYIKTSSAKVTNALRGHRFR